MRHPLPLLTSEVRPIDLSRSHTLLLLQDLHQPFADPENGSLARSADTKVVRREFDEYFDTLQLITPNVAALLGAARELGLTVAYSCLGYREPDNPSSWQEAVGWTWNLAGPDGAFPEGWQPRPDELVFAKPAWGALSSQAFVSFLEERDLRNVLVVGSMFDFGIQHTCYELADRGLGCLVASDGVAALTRAGHTATAGNIAHGTTKLRSTAEILDLLSRLEAEGTVRV